MSNLPPIQRIHNNQKRLVDLGSQKLAIHLLDINKDELRANILIIKLKIGFKTVTELYKIITLWNKIFNFIIR